jgi:hypothetical protein
MSIFNFTLKFEVSSVPKVTDALFHLEHTKNLGWESNGIEHAIIRTVQVDSETRQNHGFG